MTVILQCEHAKYGQAVSYRFLIASGYEIDWCMDCIATLEERLFERFSGALGG